MKNLKILTILIVLLFVAGCNSNQVEEALATQNALAVKLTVQANEIEGLKTQLAQPTATCEPCVVPTSPATPTATLAPTESATITPTLTPTSAAKTGSLSGNLQYPAGFMPALRIVAINTVGGYYHWQNTVAGQMSYRFDNLPVGKYWLMAYRIDNPSEAGAYSQFVPCGLSATCTDHSLIVVEVKESQETKDVNPSDWYAEPASWAWPKDPTQK